MVTVFPKPLDGDKDTSKPAGAVAVISPVRALPETVNCCKLGSAEAEPAQAEMVPDTGPAVIPGEAYTVILKVIDVPEHPSELFCGVTIILALTVVLPVFVAVNEGISPVPLAGKPMDGVSLVQVYEVAVPVKVIGVVVLPLL